LEGLLAVGVLSIVFLLVSTGFLHKVKVFENGNWRLLTRGVSHRGLAIYIKKYVKTKEEELWKLKYFTMPKYNCQKNL
jgi:hypothetical protein